MLTPWLVGLAAAGLAADMAGATIANATMPHNTRDAVDVWLTAVLCAVFVLLAYGRRQQIKGLEAAFTGNRGPTRHLPGRSSAAAKRRSAAPSEGRRTR